jgi:hypothetical protein
MVAIKIPGMNDKIMNHAISNGLAHQIHVVSSWKAASCCCDQKDEIEFQMETVITKYAIPRSERTARSAGDRNAVTLEMGESL